MQKYISKYYTEMISAPRGDHSLMQIRQVHEKETVTVSHTLAPGKKARHREAGDFESVEFEKKYTAHWLNINCYTFRKNRATEFSVTIDKEHLGELIKKLTELHSQMI